MAYILSSERDKDPGGSFQKYQDYVDTERHRFPSSVLALIESDWYFGCTDHGAPHDSSLREIRITEIPGEHEEFHPQVQIRVRLLGSRHDGEIEFIYSGVVSYEVGMMDLTRGHCDWRYDEFRLADSGDVIHEIEWYGATGTGRWLIQARNVEHRWNPAAGVDRLAE